MKKTIVILLAVVVFFIYQQIDAVPDVNPETGESDGGNTTQSGWLEFLEYLGANLAGELAFKGLSKLIYAAITRLRAKGVITAAEKIIAKEAVKVAETTAEKTAIKVAEEEAIRVAEQQALKEAERIAEQEAVRIAEQEAVRIAEKEATNIAEKEAVKVVETEAERLAIQEAERLAQQEAKLIAEKELARIAEQEAVRIAEKEAVALDEKVALETTERLAVRTATLGAKVSGMMVQLATGPWGWVLLGIETALYAGLGLDPSMFKPCENGELDLGALPAWAQGLISAVPLVGDLFTLIGGLLCFKESCPAEFPENSGGLCYKPCEASYKSDGATVCWKQYGDYWENKGFPAAPTITSITKTVLTNTGVPYSTCGEGMEQSGLICYEKCKPGYTGVGPVCWANIITVGNGVGNIPDKAPCEPGQRDDGTSCWEDWKCNTVCDAPNGRRDAFGNCWAWDLKTTCGGCGCIKKTLFGRQYAGNPNQELIGALVYDKCPAGMEHPPGLPNQCRTIGEISYGRGVGSPMKCGAGQTEDSLGLCYNAPPEGFEKTTLGLMADKCPEGTTDFGVGCTRQSYNRGAGKVGLSIYLKPRESYYGKEVGPGYFPGT